MEDDQQAKSTHHESSKLSGRFRHSVTSHMSSAFAPSVQKHERELTDLLESTNCLRRILLKVLKTPAFDYTMGVIIFLNMVIMIIELDQNASEHEPTSSASWTEICGWIVLVIFVIELMIRVFAFQRGFWTDAWNICDFLIVVVDAGFSIMGLVVGDAFPVSMLRIFRLAKLARISKVLRVFPELRVLLACLVGSTRAILWGIVLLFFVLLVWAMIAVLFIHPLAKEIDFDGCDRCPQAYNSVMRAALTFWQQIVAGDSWGQATIPVIEKHPASVLFFIPMFMTVGMAVMNLILGVVVNVALGAKEQIESEDNIERRLFKMEQHTHLLDLCHQMDPKRTGKLSREKVFESFDQPGEFRDCIMSMEVTEEDFNIIWTVVDADRKGSVRYTELLKRLYNIRNSDSEFMLAYIKYYITVTRNDLLREWQDLSSRMQKMEFAINGTPPGGNSKEEQKQVLEAHAEVPLDAVEQSQAEGVESESWGIESGTWETLEERIENLHQLQNSKEPEVKNNGMCSVVPVEDSHGRAKNCKAPQAKSCSSLASANVIERPAAWDKQFCYDIEAMQIQLKQSLEDMTQKLESQVSLVFSMNQKMNARAPNCGPPSKRWIEHL